MTSIEKNGPSAGESRIDLGIVPGTVFDGALPSRLIEDLRLISGTGSVSDKTSITNHVLSVFEGWTGKGWPDSYFDRVAAAEHPVIGEWEAFARRLVASVAGAGTVEPATTGTGRRFTQAVVRSATSGVEWHFDSACLEYEGTELDLGQDARQYSVITYLNTPEGGELEVAAWRPAVIGAHPTRSYPIDEGLFASADRVRVRPVTGRTVVLSSEFAHRVHTTPTPRKFITMFVAVSGDGRRAVSFG
ncbi:hypothetical protein BKD26_26545 [Streptomyces sp. CB03238]|nr:hypothetical protein BKD26_26545 [Streptomyces sp. CB03238]